MKNKILLVVFLVFSSQLMLAQEEAKEFGNSFYLTGGNPFDGEYAAIGVQSKGGNFPYEEPLLLIRYMKDNLEVFISDCGYYIDKPIIEFIFDKEDQRYRPDFGLSVDKKSIFLENLNGSGELSAIIDKMLNAKMLYVQIREEENRAILTYDLKGFKEAYTKLKEKMN